MSAQTNSQGDAGSGCEQVLVFDTALCRWRAVFRDSPKSRKSWR
jgi:hypothetical protein